MIYDVTLIKQIDAEISIEGDNNLKDLCNVDFAETEDVVILHTRMIKKIYEELLSTRKRLEQLEKKTRRRKNA